MRIIIYKSGYGPINRHNSKSEGNRKLLPVERQSIMFDWQKSNTMLEICVKKHLSQAIGNWMEGHLVNSV